MWLQLVVSRIHWRHVMVRINVCHVEDAQKIFTVQGLLESGQGCILVVSRMTKIIQGRDPHQRKEAHKYPAERPPEQARARPPANGMG